MYQIIGQHECISVRRNGRFTTERTTKDSTVTAAAWAGVSEAMFLPEVDMNFCKLLQLHLHIRTMLSFFRKPLLLPTTILKQSLTHLALKDALCNHKSSRWAAYAPNKLLVCKVDLQGVFCGNSKLVLPFLPQINVPIKRRWLCGELTTFLLRVLYNKLFKDETHKYPWKFLFSV